MVQRYYKDLKKAFAERDLDRPYLAELLKMSVATLNAKLQGIIPWRLAECYKVLELMKEPPCMLTYYFPVADVKKEPAATDSTRISA